MTWIHVSGPQLQGLLAARGRGGAGRGAREAAGPHVSEARLVSNGVNFVAGV